ncbi:MAG: signal peptide peptidase SppA [Novosphingobium sp.]
MEFAGKVWRLLVGIKDGLALLFLLLFFALLYAVLSVRPDAGAVRDGALLLTLDGAVVEEPARVDALDALLSGRVPAGQYRARDIVHALRTAAKDDRIKAVVLDLSNFSGGGMVTLQDVGAAMDEVRAAKKPVLTYAVGYADDGMLLAAHASEVWVDPMGGAVVIGPGGNNIYFGGLIEKLKVNAHVFRVGTFKSAVEPYMRDGPSPEARENASALYDALFDAWKADVAKARPKANLALVTTDPAGWFKASGGDAAKAALAAGLVDRIGTQEEFGKRVAEIAGKDTIDTGPGTFAYTSLRNWLAAHPPSQQGKAIGVVTVAGEIVDGDAGPGAAGGERIAKILDDALDSDLSALVLRVDSPGGSIFASEEIRLAVERHKRKGIPVVVSMANLAASGGYWVSTPANRIFAEPGTITGSIGVFAVLPTFERTLAEFGVTADGVKTTPLSGQPDIAGGLSPEVSQMVQANVESSYGRFLGLVAASRRKSVEEVARIAEGRVWDGGAGRQIGLVDQFGGLDDALASAASLAKLKDGEWHAEYLEDEEDALSVFFRQWETGDDSSAPAEARDWAGMVAVHQASLVDRALGEFKRVMTVRGTQAYCLECPAPVRGETTARSDIEGRGLLALLARWLGP